MLTLKQLRSKIEKIDANIIKKLAERQEISKKIGQVKIQSEKHIVDKQREKKLLAFYEDVCAKYDLDPVYAKRLFKIIISNSRKLQK